MFHLPFIIVFVIIFLLILNAVFLISFQFNDAIFKNIFLKNAISLQDINDHDFWPTSFHCYLGIARRKTVKCLLYGFEFRVVLCQDSLLHKLLSEVIFNPYALEKRRSRFMLFSCVNEPYRPLESEPE